MTKTELIKLKRGCDAVQVPSGELVKMRKGTIVEIMQALGDTYTLMTKNGLLVRLTGENADAIGQKKKQAPRIKADTPIEKQVLRQLETCYDPEIPVNIVELGLIYEYKIKGTAKTGYTAQIKMSLTAPGCGMGDVLAKEIGTKVKRLPNMKKVKVALVFDPPWDPSRMSKAARLHLGML